MIRLRLYARVEQDASRRNRGRHGRLAVRAEDLTGEIELGAEDCLGLLVPAQLMEIEPDGLHGDQCLRMPVTVQRGPLQRSRAFASASATRPLSRGSRPD